MGSRNALFGAVLIVAVWAITGPIFHYSDTWQLIINTGTTIVTFLMIFLAQNDSNRNMLSLHLKLDEVIRSHDQADNVFIASEDHSEEELRDKIEALKELSTAAQLLNKPPDSMSSDEIDSREILFDKLKKDVEENPSDEVVRKYLGSIESPSQQVEPSSHRSLPDNSNQ